MLQCVAVCCSVLQCVAVCCSVLQCVAVRVLLCVAVRCSALQSVCELQCTRVTDEYSIALVLEMFLFTLQCVLQCTRVTDDYTIALVLEIFLFTLQYVLLCVLQCVAVNACICSALLVLSVFNLYALPRHAAVCVAVCCSACCRVCCSKLQSVRVLQRTPSSVFAFPLCVACSPGSVLQCVLQ